MEREVRYCTTEDGVRIAYCVEGEGPPLLHMPFFLESFYLDHVFPEHIEPLRRIARGLQLIRFDTRGTGLSERNVTDMSRAALLLDAKAVVGALGLRRFHLWGTAIGGVRALEYAARHPRYVDRLVLHGAFARVADAFPGDTLRGLAQLARSNWDLAARTLADFSARRDSDEVGLRLAELYRQSTTGEIAANLFESNTDVDLTPLLPKVKAITLVLHQTDDNLFPIALAQKLAAAIPNARLVPLRGSTWVVPSRRAEFDVMANAFLRAQDYTTEPRIGQTAGTLRTVLFTDIAGSTEMMQRLGDEKGREVLREHERITREVLRAHGGTEVKTMGDGFMASFGSVTKAVECAIALQRAFAEREGEPLSVRVGLNAGEPIEEEGDLFGATVILAARIASQAEGGEVLASMAVRELCAGKGFLFADRGEFVAKGFEEPVRLFEVRWRE